MPRKPNTTGVRYNDPFYKTLRRLMDENKITQDVLADVLGVKNRQSVTGYIDGSTVPSMDKLIALADFFGVSVDYLIGVSKVETRDNNLRFVCEYTGLSEQTIKTLHQISCDNKSEYLYPLFLVNLLDELCNISSNDADAWEKIAKDVTMAGAAVALPTGNHKENLFISSAELSEFFLNRATKQFSFHVEKVFSDMVACFVDYASGFSFSVTEKNSVQDTEHEPEG